VIRGRGSSVVGREAASRVENKKGVDEGKTKRGSTRGQAVRLRGLWPVLGVAVRTVEIKHEKLVYGYLRR
jgi:hypothetical protein